MKNQGAFGDVYTRVDNHNTKGNKVRFVKGCDGSWDPGPQRTYSNAERAHYAKIAT